jgi:hypothetical protein
MPPRSLKVNPLPNVNIFYELNASPNGVIIPSVRQSLKDVLNTMGGLSVVIFLLATLKVLFHFTEMVLIESQLALIVELSLVFRTTKTSNEIS